MVGKCLVVVVMTFALAACGETRSTAHDGATWRATVDTIGDTVVVRTVGGSVWDGPMTLVPAMRIGELESSDDAYLIGSLRSMTVAADGSIYTYDSQAKALRKYDANGRFVARFGREGGGPGEYRNPDGGLSALADGRIVLRDPGNARMTVFTSDGELSASWPIRGGFNQSRQSTVGRNGRLYQPVLRDPAAPLSEWRYSLVEWTPDGLAADTLHAPVIRYEPPFIEARRENSWSRNSVPFSGQPFWRYSPLGYFVTAVGTRYAVELLRPDGVLRIERDAPAVPVTAAERDNAIERATFDMRRTDPSWRWNGPPVPETKPALRDVFVARDGRIWVLTSQPSERIPDDEIDARTDTNRPPPLRWREPIAFDVFEPDGRFLGSVVAPRGFSIFPEPVFDGDHVWAVARGEYDVQQLVRFRIAREP